MAELISKIGCIPNAVKEGVSRVFANQTNSCDIAMKILDVSKDKDNYSEFFRKGSKKFYKELILKKFDQIYAGAFFI